MTAINKDILTTLAYFDMFKYPLTRVEIFLFLQQKHQHAEFETALRYMVANQSIYIFGSYYSLRNDATLIKRRVDGNQKAAVLIKTAHRISEWLIAFPFVKGVAISGSLSKNFADDDSDIDLFIITTKNRLWIARTLMHSLKKLAYLFNKQHYFCMNYYVDESQLQIMEKNIYTATEVATLMPLQGDMVFEQFFSENKWTKTYLPNNYLRLSSAKPVKTNRVKQFFEFLMDNKLGDAVDKLLMNITSKRWQKKTAGLQLNMHGFILQMYADRHCSKPDPVNFQQKILQRYDDKISNILEKDESSMVY